MGIFSTIKKAVGACVSKIAEVFDSEKLAKIGAKLEECTSETAKQIGVTKSYKPESGNAKEIDRVNTILADYVLTVKSDVKNIEYSLLALLDNISDRICACLDDSNIISRVRSMCSDAQNQLKNSITRGISDSIGVGNSTCEEIMKMKPSDKKTKRMEEFVSGVKKNALANASVQVKFAILDIQREAETEIRDKIDYSISILRESTERLNELKQYSSDTDVTADDLETRVKAATSVVALLNSEVI